ncbi:MAG TPA: hypothetical protein VEH28_03550 [Thermoplasmata archaeon]|nr:hypothetical protein [Thermoplasmata archaeon]
MRRPEPSDALLMKVARGLLLGAAGGLVATGVMYALAAVELAVTGVAPEAWGPAIETGFGGNVGSVLGLSGWALHVVHGLAIGALFEIALAAIQPRARTATMIGVGLGLGVLLWAGVLALSPATRAVQGAGPPILLSALMHLAFGGTVAATVLAGARWWRRVAREPDDK